MKAIFIGCIDFSKTLLEVLIKGNQLEIVGIVTKNKSPLNSDFFDLSEIGNAHNIPLFYYEGKKSDQDLINWVKEKSPTITFCFGWSHILPIELIQIPAMGTMGYHPSELPLNRGRHPIIWALALGLSQTASTFFMVDESADSGNIVSQGIIPIDVKDNAATLYKKLLKLASDQLHQIAIGLKNNKLPQIPQNHSVANNWRKRTELDGIIDWRMSTKAILNLIRALSAPYPGAFFLHLQKKITVWEAEEFKNDQVNLEPGKILAVNENFFIVKTYDSAIKIISFEGDFIPVTGEYI